jgi:hypothetical protein
MFLYVGLEAGDAPAGYDAPLNKTRIQLATRMHIS